MKILPIPLVVLTLCSAQPGPVLNLGAALAGAGVGRDSSIDVLAAAEASKLNAQSVRHFNAGRYADAEQALLAALTLEAGERIRATTLNNLGSTYVALGRRQEAEYAFQKALELREQVLGPDHPDVAATLSNLALVYQSEGLPAKAEPLFRRSLEISERVLGSRHPRVAKLLNSLGVLYASTLQFDRAEAVFRRALELDAETLPPEHPDVIRTTTRLAEVYLAQHRNTEAELLYEPVIPRIETTPGMEHDLVKALSNLAEAYRTDGRCEKAGVLYRRVMAILNGKPELETDAALVAIEHYTEMLRKQKRKAEAREVDREINSILRR